LLLAALIFCLLCPCLVEDSLCPGWSTHTQVHSAVLNSGQSQIG
jgi:hypothetical protein